VAKKPFLRDESYDEPVNVEMDPEDAMRVMLTEPPMESTDTE
jgi:hypothetical protein